MIYAYPQPGKLKSRAILVDFMLGAGGYVADPARGLRRDGSGSAFYGTVGIEPLFRQAQAAGDWFYIDNAYLDVARGRYFRISRNAYQVARRDADRARLAELDVQVRPWRSSGRHILIVEQSNYFLSELAKRPSWLLETLVELRRHTDRPLRIRPWYQDKLEAARTLAVDLVDAWALVTHSSAAANQAILAGIPVFVSGQCVAAELGNRDLAQIEAPVMPDDCREEWAARLAASQWRLDEMRAGIAWRALKEEAGQ